MNGIEWRTVLSVTCSLLAVSLVSFLILDCAAGHTETYQCPIVDHGHQPAYTTTSIECISHDTKTGSCNIWIPVEHHHPERWWLVYQHAEQAGGGLGQFDVGLRQWQETQRGELVTVKYVVGRYTKHYYGLGQVR